MPSALRRPLVLGGCADGVELNGKVFDLLGVSPAALEASRREPKLAERAPLVMPPDANRLPDPGSAQAAPTDQANWPTDPEQRKLAAAQERERLHPAPLSRRHPMEGQGAQLKGRSGTNLSPYGPCLAAFSAGLPTALTRTDRADLDRCRQRRQSAG